MRPKWSAVRKLEGQVSSEFIKLDQLGELEEERREAEGLSAVMKGRVGCCHEATVMRLLRGWIV